MTEKLKPVLFARTIVIIGSAFAAFLLFNMLSNFIANEPIPLMAESMAEPVAKSTNMKFDDGITNRQTILVHFAPNAPDAERRQIISDVGGVLLDWIEPINVAVVQITQDANDDVSGQSLLATSETVEHVEADGWVYGTYEPDDPDLYDPERVYTAELLKLYEAWDYTIGDPDIVIAVLDTGIAFNHPEFANKVLSGYDFYNRDDDPTDDHGHGTHVAGTSAANINNGVGAAGLCGGCSILPVKVLNQNNAGTWSGVAAGVTYAADEGANIIVMSLGSVAGTRTIEEAIRYAVEKDVLIFAASGNINSSKDFFPAAYPGVMGVAATDKSDRRWSLSNYGDYVDISAPGHLIYGAHKDLDNLYDGHLFMSGTSMATPHAGGLAGLLWSQDPSRSRDDIEQLMMETAVDLGDAGRDKYFGAGRIDPAAALAKGANTQKNAQLSGITWQDTNADTLLDEDESVRVPNVLLQLKNVITNETILIRSNNRGFWKANDVPTGNYVINVIGNTSIHTQPNTLINVAGQQSLDHVNVGVVSELPDSVLLAIAAERDNSNVVLSWKLNSDLVDTLVLERALDDGNYQRISQDVMGTARINTADRNQFIDRLPQQANEAKISYRFLVSPGESYIDGIIVRPPNSQNSVRLPFLSK